MIEDNKIITIIGYILIGILLLPLIAIGIYIGIGAILFYILFIIDRVKNGENNIKDGKGYKTASGIFALIATGAAIIIFRPELNIFNIETFFIVQGVVFIGLLPLSYYKYLRIRHHCFDPKSKPQIEDKDILK